MLQYMLLCKISVHKTSVPTPPPSTNKTAISDMDSKLLGTYNSKSVGAWDVIIYDRWSLLIDHWGLTWQVPLNSVGALYSNQAYKLTHKVLTGWLVPSFSLKSWHGWDKINVAYSLRYVTIDHFPLNFKINRFLCWEHLYEMYMKFSTWHGMNRAWA